MSYAVKRVDYTHHEREKIVQYIIENKAYCNLRGINFWKRLENAKVVNRTWQSLKQHFKTKIVTNIQSFNIPKEEQKKIVDGYNSTKCHIVSKYNKKVFIPHKHENLEMDFSDDEQGSKKSYKRVTLSSESSDSSSDFASTTNRLSTSFENRFKKQTLTYKANKSSSSRNNAQQINLIDSDEDTDNSFHFTSTPAQPKISFQPFQSSSKQGDEFNREDMALIQFLKNDLELANDIHKPIFYKYFLSTNKSKKSWMELRERFINHILPNIHRYNWFSEIELQQIYRATDVSACNALRHIATATNDIPSSDVSLQKRIKFISTSAEVEIIPLNNPNAAKNKCAPKKLKRTATVINVESPPADDINIANDTAISEDLDSTPPNLKLRLNKKSTINKANFKKLNTSLNVSNRMQRSDIDVILSSDTETVLDEFDSSPKKISVSTLTEEYTATKATECNLLDDHQMTLIDNVPYIFAVNTNEEQNEIFAAHLKKLYPNFLRENMCFVDEEILSEIKETIKFPWKDLFSDIHEIYTKIKQITPLRYQPFMRKIKIEEGAEINMDFRSINIKYEIDDIEFFSPTASMEVNKAEHVSSISNFWESTSVEETNQSENTHITDFSEAEDDDILSPLNEGDSLQSPETFVTCPSQPSN